MIDKITIRNFQSHELTKLKLHPGVNVITGATDSGKTAIVRALRLGIHNRPGGESFRSNWGGDTSVDIKLNEGSKVTRIKSKENIYILDKKKFTAFKTNVPEEINKALNMSEINLQNQHDAPFLFSKSPGEVAAHFNKIANIGQIDSGTKAINKSYNDAVNKLKFTREDLKDKKEKLTQYAYLIKFDIKLEVLEDKHGTISQKANIKRKLESWMDSHTKVSKKENKLLPLLKMGEKVKELTGKMVTVALINETNKRVEGIRDQLEKIGKQEEALNALLKIEASVQSILDTIKKEKEQTTAMSRLRLIVLELKTNKKQTQHKLNKVQTLNEEFKTQMPEVCPLCGSIKKHNHE